MQVDMSTWGKFNLWLDPGGSPCVRPGLRSIASAPSGRRFVDGFSVPSQYTGETWHYVLTVATSGVLDARMHVFDENFQAFQELALNLNREPRALSYGIVEGQIIVGSPDMPTLWGLIGSGLRVATSVPSDNPATTAIDIPRGMVTSWGNRIVIANGFTVWVSDPVAATGGSPRTFVAQNQNARPGIVYGIHEGAGGMLVCVTSAGVYGLDSAAAAVGIVGANGTAWQLLSHHRATSYNSSCVVRGRVWGLTRRGYSLIDTSTDEQVEVSDAVAPRASYSRIALNDYRGQRLLAGEFGPLLSLRDLPAMHMHDLARGFRSWWWQTQNMGSPVAVLTGYEGEQMLLFPGSVRRVFGDFDGDTALTSTPDFVAGGFFGRIPTDGVNNPTLRTAIASTTGDVLSVAVRGRTQTATVAMVTDGPVVGANSWEDANVWFTDAPLQAERTQWNVNADEMTVEVSARGCTTRIDTTLTAELSASAPARTVSRGNRVAP